MVPIYREDKQVGWLQSEPRGLYTRFYGEVEEPCVSRVYAQFAGGSCPLGIPVPEGGKLCLRASMPTAKLPLGALERGYLQPAAWEPFSGGSLGGVTYPPGLRRGNVLRFPWHPGQPLPAEEPALFFRFLQENGESFLELPLDDQAQPAREPLQTKELLIP